MNIPKAIKLIALLIAGFSVQHKSHAEPAELIAARTAYETKLAVPKAKLDTAMAARGKQYAIAVKALEDRATREGKLDVVVLLKAEREAYEQGRQTIGYGTKALRVPPEARDARRLLDGDVARILAAGLPDGRRVAEEYVKALDGIERKLTMQKDVAGAMQVRKERTAMMQDGMNPFGSDAAQNSAFYRQLLNTTWKWWGDETITFLPDRKARWSGGGAPWPWKVDNEGNRVISGEHMSKKRRFTITFESDLKTGTIVGDDATRTTRIVTKGP